MDFSCLSSLLFLITWNKQTQILILIVEVRDTKGDSLNSFTFILKGKLILPLSSSSLQHLTQIRLRTAQTQEAGWLRADRTRPGLGSCRWWRSPNLVMTRRQPDPRLHAGGRRSAADMGRTSHVWVNIDTEGVAGDAVCWCSGHLDLETNRTLARFCPR